MFEPEELGQRKDELAGALREARKRAGLTGNRLAARCGISQSKISKIETGKVLPDVTYHLQLFSFFEQYAIFDEARSLLGSYAKALRAVVLWPLSFHDTNNFMTRIALPCLAHFY